MFDGIDPSVKLSHSRAHQKNMRLYRTITNKVVTMAILSTSATTRVMYIIYIYGFKKSLICVI